MDLLESKKILWVLRVIVKLNLIDDLIKNNSDILKHNKTKQDALKRFKNELKRLEDIEKTKGLKIQPLSDNIDRIASFLNLNEIDKKIVEFLVIKLQDDVFEELGNGTRELKK